MSSVVPPPPPPTSWIATLGEGVVSLDLAREPGFMERELGALTSILGSCFWIPFREILTSNMPEGGRLLALQGRPDGAVYYPASQKPRNPQICRPSKSLAKRELGVRGQPNQEKRRTSITPALLPSPSPGYRVGAILQARTEPRILGAPGMGMDRDVTGFLHPSFLGLLIIKASSSSLTSVLLATTIFLLIFPPWI